MNEANSGAGSGKFVRIVPLLDEHAIDQEGDQAFGFAHAQVDMSRAFLGERLNRGLAKIAQRLLLFYREQVRRKRIWLETVKAAEFWLGFFIGEIDRLEIFRIKR